MFRIWKGFALIAGAGVGAGLVRALLKGPVQHAVSDIKWEPLLERVERIEAGPDNASLERKLLEHSISLRALHERIETSEANLQGLVAAVERLCDRTEASRPPAAVPGPFEVQLEQAMENPPTPRVIKPIQGTATR